MRAKFIWPCLILSAIALPVMQVTRDERQDIRKDERQTSRAIYRQKHDGQVRR